MVAGGVLVGKCHIAAGRYGEYLGVKGSTPLIDALFLRRIGRRRIVVNLNNCIRKGLAITTADGYLSGISGGDK